MVDSHPMKTTFLDLLRKAKSVGLDTAPLKVRYSDILPKIEALRQNESTKRPCGSEGGGSVATGAAGKPKFEDVVVSGFCPG